MELTDRDDPRILIVRLSAIGDIVFASPLIHALRQRYPRARLYWLVQPESRALLECHPELDEVIVWPRGEWQSLWQARRWGALWRAVRRFRQQLKAHHFDLALDVQGLMKSGLLCRLSGAHRRIGLGSREGSQWLMHERIPKGGEPRRIGSEYLYFAERLGLPNDSFEMQVGLCEADQAFAGQLLAEEHLEDGFVAICPFTTRPQKHWFNPRWSELVEAAQRHWGMPVMMLGGPGDREAAKTIRPRNGGRLIDRVGETSLRQAAAILARARLVVGVDTGLTHIGIAMNRPTLCLFGSTRPYLDTTHANAEVIYHPRNCSPCKRHPTCHEAFDCMADISVDEILERAGRLPGFSGGEA
ncbi:MAG: glycosyltransferase family 9 protein [Candidatus Thiodiazotropha sp.]